MQRSKNLCEIDTILSLLEDEWDKPTIVWVDKDLKTRHSFACRITPEHKRELLEQLDRAAAVRILWQCGTQSRDDRFFEPGLDKNSLPSDWLKLVWP